MQETKEYILKTSLSLFLQKSYRDVTMSEIVTKTGLSKGAFYHYFPSKEALFKEIATLFLSMGGINYSAFSSHSLQSFYTEYVNYLDNTFSEINQWVSGADSNSSKFNFFLILFEAVSRFPEFLHMELEMHHKDINAWKSIISKARASHEIQSDSSDEEIANLFLFCTDGVFIRFINNDKNHSYKDFLRSAYDTIYQNIRT